MQQDAEELYSTVVNTLAQSLKEVGVGGVAHRSAGQTGLF